MPNAITSLKADHTKVKKLLRQLEATTERGVKIREDLVNQIEMELKVHAKLEEEIFYPAFKNAASKKDDKEMFFEAAEEHHVVDMVLPELKMTSPKSEHFGAKAKVLKELLEHHIEEEETEMFARARVLLSDEELRELGDKMLKRKEMLVAMWENPLTRPVQKVISALQKVAPTSLKTAKATVLGKKPARESGRERRA
jgi:hemerythrin-like domain-containing protein